MDSILEGTKISLVHIQFPFLGFLFFWLNKVFMVFVVHFIDIWESLLYKPSLGIHFPESHLYR